MPYSVSWLDCLSIEEGFKSLIYPLVKEVLPLWEQIDKLSVINQQKVLDVFRFEQVSDSDFGESTGYGYQDLGREKLERIFSKIFGGEASLVRSQLLSGTHALSVSLFGLLRPGDQLLTLTGPPYDTLLQVIEGKSVKGTLKEWGIEHKVLPLLNSGQPDISALNQQVSSRQEKPALAMIQRSPGYSSIRPSLKVREIENLISEFKRVFPQVPVLIDNCYGELVEPVEPLEVGADVMAGSLIKNPGGGIAPTGGYITGKEELVERISSCYSAPGLGNRLGSMGEKRNLFMGLFNAPQLVANALKTAVWSARLFKEMGFPVSPGPEEQRGDIVQKIELGEEKLVKRMLQAIQKYSPVESYLTPEASAVPGYEDPIIMAAGTFVQGASSELSADAPLRSPYMVFLQGSLTWPHGLIAVTRAAEEIYYQ